MTSNCRCHLQVMVGLDLHYSPCVFLVSQSEKMKDLVEQIQVLEAREYLQMLDSLALHSALVCEVPAHYWQESD